MIDGVQWIQGTGKIFEFYTTSDPVDDFFYTDVWQVFFGGRKSGKSMMSLMLGDFINHARRVEVSALIYKQMFLWDRLKNWPVRVIKGKPIVDQITRQEWLRQQRLMNKKRLPGR